MTSRAPWVISVSVAGLESQLIGWRRTRSSRVRRLAMKSAMKMDRGDDADGRSGTPTEIEFDVIGDGVGDHDDLASAEHRCA